MPYGFPSGEKLSSDILNLGEAKLHSLLRTSFPSGLARDFHRDFNWSKSSSIDSFLAQQPRYADIGRAAIAACLLPYEQVGSLMNQPRDEDWYQYLVDAMEAPWEHLSGNRLAFVTFNYDRSLEQYLRLVLQHRHPSVTDEQALAFVEKLPIVHVYGSLGSLNPKSPTFVPFGGKDGDIGYREIAAKHLQVIPEGRRDSPTFEAARNLLEGPEALCFLGFSFDKTNVERLGGQDISAGGRHTSRGYIATEFAGTGYKLTDRERMQAASRIAHSREQSNVAKSLLPIKCRDLLRETLILQ